MARQNQTNKTPVERITAAVRRITLARFTSYLDRYVKILSVTDGLKNHQRGIRFFKKRFSGAEKTKYGAYYAGIERETSVILSQSKLLLDDMTNFRFRMNGQYKGISEADRNTLLYFNKMRRQQLDLLMGISEEIENIRDTIQRTGEMQHIVRKQSETIRNTERLMDIISERFSQHTIPPVSRPALDSGGYKEEAKAIEEAERVMDIAGEKLSPRFIPLVLPALGSGEEGESEAVVSGWNPPSLKIECKYDKDKETRQLTEIFGNIRECEDSFGDKLKQDGKEHLPEKAIAVYSDLVRDSFSDIERRKQKIITEVRELKQGWKLLKRLATKGYSPRMHRGLEVLLNTHSNRKDEFQEYVRECRRDFYNI
ncbi:hypothetical protein QUF72_21300 [Desulfobacterales bacterium HSG2]|nr:hypothetical protein [Desulfobacterales bacterium HSG2]